MNHYLNFILISTMLFASCNPMPDEIRMNQLAAVRYYKEETKGDIIRKTHFYYKPNIYMFGSKPYTGMVKDYTEKNELKSEGPMKDGFPDGHWKYFNANGSIKSEGYYVDGVKDSLWHDYYTDGSPKLLMKFTLQNDSLRRDTIGAWMYGGQRILEANGDTVKHYYKDGRLHTKLIKGENYLEEDYYIDGTLIYRKDKRRKESYYTNGKLRSRTYYLQDKNQLVDIMAEKNGWTQEEKDALAKADSVQFDYSSLWDPVMKIYIKE